MKNQIMSSTQRAGFDKFYAGELGQQLACKVHTIKALFSFAVNGGAVASYILSDVFGNEIIIPNGAIIKNVLINVTTAFTSSGGTGTIALTLNSAGDLLAAIDADTLSTMHAGIPINTAATVVKATAQRNIVASVATAALTAGACEIYIDVLYVA